MYCSIEEAWGTDEGCVRKKSSAVKKKISSTNAIAMANRKKEEEGYVRSRFQSENIAPMELDGESVDTYMQFEESLLPPSKEAVAAESLQVASEETTSTKLAKNTIDLLSRKIDAMLTKINQIQQQQVACTNSGSGSSSNAMNYAASVGNTILGLFLGIMVIFLLDMSFRYGREGATGGA